MAEYLHGIHSRSPKVEQAYLDLGYRGALHDDAIPDTTDK
jgi:hypothetical protein